MSQEKKIKSPSNNSRRSFLKDAALASAGFYIIPRHVMGRGFIAPSDKLTIASIGAGGKGADDIKHFYASGKANIAYLCDVDDKNFMMAYAGTDQKLYMSYFSNYNPASWMQDILMPTKKSCFFFVAI